MLRVLTPASWLTLCCQLFIGQSLADDIKIYTWEDYLSPEVIQQFTHATGHTISQVYFESEQLRDEVLNSDRIQAYDLVIVDSSSLKSMNEKQLMRPLTSANIKNLTNSSPQSRQECGQTGIPYTWGTMGIAYRTSKFTQPVTSWMAILKPAPKHVQKLTIPFDDIDTIAPALMALGYDPFTSDQKQLMAAYRLLESVKPKVKAFRNAQAYTAEFKTQSDLDIAIAFSGETESIRDATQQSDWQYVIPKEGSLIWFECLSAPSSVPLKPATIQFLNFLQQPAIAAKNAEDIGFATTNTAALKYTSESYRNNQELFPDRHMLKHSVPYHPISLSGLTLRTRILSVLGTTSE